MSDKTADLQSIYLNALEAYKTEVDDEGDITFRHPEMGFFYISLDAEKDPEFFRLVFPNFVDDKRLELPREQLLELANQVNINNKAAKLTVRHLSSDDTWNVSSQIEAFIAGPDNLPDAELVSATLARNISAIRASVSSFLTLVRELKENGQGGNSQQGDSI